MPNLQDLPLPLAIIVAAFYVIQQSNAASAKQLVALIDAFGKEYGALIKDYQALTQSVSEDRREARDRWLERDRLLNERLDRNTIEAEQNKSEMHKLRSTLQPIVAQVDQMFRATVPGRTTRRTGGNPDAASD